MNRCLKITDANNLLKLIQTKEDKLIVVVFYIKTETYYKKLMVLLEQLANHHVDTLFCLVDIQSFENNDRIVQTHHGLPRIECYYLNNSLGTYWTNEEKDIQSIVKNGEKFVNNQNSKLKQNTFETNYLHSQAMVLNEAQKTNPTYFQHLLKNPLVLQQVVQTVMNGASMTQFNHLTTEKETIPTFNQLSTMFQIFTMMVQMGVLNIPQTVNDNQNNVTLLPNGDKLIALTNGKYGLIKKN